MVRTTALIWHLVVENYHHHHHQALILICSPIGEQYFVEMDAPFDEGLLILIRDNLISESFTFVTS